MLTPPIEPMLAAPLGHQLPPPADAVAFEPKWDGFRCLLFRSAEGVVLQGRGRSRTSADEIVDLAYAFPEICAAAIEQLPPGIVLDGEIVDRAGRSARLRRPVQQAAAALGGRAGEHRPARRGAASGLPRLRRALVRRRRHAPAVRGATSGARGGGRGLVLRPSCSRRRRRIGTLAWSWFTGFESAGVDGLIVKPLADPYLPGKRAQGKVKHQRSADVVVAGWRAHTKPGADGEAGRRQPAARPE